MERKGGYTLVETTLAMAVSGLMILLTIGLAGMVARQRFRDSMVSTATFVQSQYNEVRSGINSRLGGDTGMLLCGSNSLDKSDRHTGNSPRCLVMGRLIKFDTNKIESQIVTLWFRSDTADSSDIANWPDPSKSALENLRTSGEKYYLQSTPSSSSDAGAAATTHDYGYGSTLFGAWIVKSGGNVQKIDDSKINLALIRSPLDGSLLSIPMNYYVEHDGYNRLSIPADDKDANLTSDRRMAIAIKNGQGGYPGGLLCIAGGDISTGVTYNYNADINWADVSDPNNGQKVREQCRNMDVIE